MDDPVEVTDIYAEFECAGGDDHTVTALGKGREYISTISAGKSLLYSSMTSPRVCRVLRSLIVPLYSTRRENVKVVTPFSLVTLISSLCCCKMVLTIYRPKP